MGPATLFDTLDDEGSIDGYIRIARDNVKRWEAVEGSAHEDPSVRVWLHDGRSTRVAEEPEAFRRWLEGP